MFMIFVFWLTLALKPDASLFETVKQQYDVLE